MLSHVKSLIHINPNPVDTPTLLHWWDVHSQRFHYQYSNYIYFNLQADKQVLFAQQLACQTRNQIEIVSVIYEYS